jgi:hypothetical protein
MSKYLKLWYFKKTVVLLKHFKNTLLPIRVCLIFALDGSANARESQNIGVALSRPHLAEALT